MSVHQQKELPAMQTATIHQRSQTQKNVLVWATAVVLFSAIILVVFRTFPNIDIFVTQLAYANLPCADETTISTCGWFPLQYNFILHDARKISLQIPYIAISGVAIFLMYHLFFKPLTTGLELGKIALVIWTLIVATVGIINLGLKEIWGRPRPFDVDRFGGDHPFVLPGTISDYCSRNCSFVSGEASSAAWLLVLLVFVPKGWRVPTGVLLAAYALFFSGLRVAVGKHFLSDVTMSVLITFSVYFVLKAVFATKYFVDLFDNIADWSNQISFNMRVK